MLKKYTRIFIVFSIFLINVSFPSHVFASNTATISTSPSSGSYNTGSTFNVAIVIDEVANPLMHGELQLL